MKALIQTQIKTLIAGTFDNFHVGHQWLIWSAIKQGSVVTIIVARDKTVESIKEMKPRNTETNRLKRVSSEVAGLSTVTTRLGRTDANFWQTIAEENPDLIMLGYDQHVQESQILEHFPNLKIERCTPYKPEFFKSSKF